MLTSVGTDGTTVVELSISFLHQPLEEKFVNILKFPILCWFTSRHRLTKSTNSGDILSRPRIFGFPSCAISHKALSEAKNERFIGQYKRVLVSVTEGFG